DAQLCDWLPGIEDPPPELGGGNDPGRLHFQVTNQHRWAETGTGPAADFKSYVHLLVGTIVLENRLQMAAVEAVALQQPGLAVHSLLQSRGCVGLAKVEPRSILELAGVGRVRDAGYRDAADKPTVPGHEGEDDAIGAGRGIHLDIRVPAGGEQAVDAGAHHSPAQRLTGLQRQDLEKFGGLQRLLLRIELNVENRL